MPRPIASAPRPDDSAGAPWWAGDAAALVSARLKALLGRSPDTPEEPSRVVPGSSWPDSFFDVDPGREP